jgi:hypothetical protein
MLGSKFAEALGALDVWSAPSERNLGGKSA